MRAAPKNPPIKVWEDEDGIPSHQVRRFQAIAATSPEKITSKVIKFSLTIFAIVFPILNPPKTNTAKKNAAKFHKAAQITAWKGVNTLVETIVAIEFAASWKPLI